MADGSRAAAVLADGLLLLEDLNQQLGTRFATPEVDALGGLVFAAVGAQPAVGDRVELGDGYVAQVEQLDGLRNASVRLLHGE